MARFLKWIVNLFMLCAIIVAAALLVPPLAGVTTVMVDDLEMDTNLATGSVTYALDTDIEELEVGDRILVTSGGATDCYRLMKIDTADGTCTLKDTLSAEEETIEKTLSDSASKVVITVPYIAYVSMALQSTEGLIIVGMVLILVVLLFILAELWRPDSDEENAEEKEKKGKKKRREKKKEKKNRDDAEESQEPAPQPMAVDASRILEEASSSIASTVSSVVAQKEEKENALAAAKAEEGAAQKTEEFIPLKETEIPSSPEETGAPAVPEETGTQAEEKKAEAVGTNEQEEPEQSVKPAREEPEKSEAEAYALKTGQTGDGEPGGPEDEESMMRIEIYEIERRLQRLLSGEPEDLFDVDEPEEPEESGKTRPGSRTAKKENSSTAKSAEMKGGQMPEMAAEADEQRFAMPIFTENELVDRAKRNGGKGEVIRDDHSGLTLVDYSDLL